MDELLYYLQGQKTAVFSTNHLKLDAIKSIYLVFDEGSFD